MTSVGRGHSIISMSEREKSFKEQLAYEYGRALAFDPERQEFIIGNGSNISVAIHIGVAEDAFDLHYIDEIPYSLVETGADYYLVTCGFNIVVLPALKRYIAGLSEQEWERLRIQVGDVIEGAVQVLKPEMRDIPRVSKGAMGIDVAWSGEGNFILRTLGNCACLGPEMYHTSYGENTPDFPQEYGLHNADSPWQRLSLYAGIGALAWFAQNSRS